MLLAPQFALLFLAMFLQLKLTAGNYRAHSKHKKHPTSTTSWEIDMGIEPLYFNTHEDEFIITFEPDLFNFQEYNKAPYTFAPFKTKNCWFSCDHDKFIIPVVFGLATLKIIIVCIYAYRKIKRRRCVLVLARHVQEHHVLIQSEVQPNTDDPPNYVEANEASDKILPPAYEP